MKRDDFKFVPLRGMGWDDLLKWVRQNSPKQVEFIDTISGPLHSLFDRRLPHAFFEDKTVTFIWSERNRQFRLKLKACLVHSDLSDVKWEVYGQDGELITEGSAVDAPWLPSKLVDDFSFHWCVANEQHMLIFQLTLALLILVTIFTGLAFVN
jgi:hypothetical protein